MEFTYQLAPSETQMPRSQKHFALSIAGPGETEQDPVVLAPHVLSLPFVCGKTLAKE